MSSGIVHGQVEGRRIVAGVKNHCVLLRNRRLEPVAEGRESQEELRDYHRLSVHLETVDHLRGVFRRQLPQEHAHAVPLRCGRRCEFVNHYQTSLSQLLGERRSHPIGREAVPDSVGRLELFGGHARVSAKVTTRAPDSIVALAEARNRRAACSRDTPTQSVMRLLSKVLWREGMHLSQHHFQAQNRYVEDTLAVALGQLCFEPHGLTELSIDDAALRGGTAMLRTARGIMPDSMPFHMPDSDALPEPREFSSVFSPTQLSHVLLLGIGPHRAAASNIGADGNGRTRYAVEQRTVRDAVSGRDERVVDVGRKNFHLLLDHEAHDDLLILPIARIRRDGTGHFVIDPEFVPPCTKITGSTKLLDLVARALQNIDAKSDALAAERDASRANMAEYAAHEVANFWLLHTLRANSSLLRHHLATREAHPERLYVDLARLVGALSTFALHGAPTDVPAYDHANLTACFGELERLLRSRLEVVVPSRSARFTLEPAGDNLYAARVEDERCYRRGKWIIGLRSTASEKTVLQRVKLLKVCSHRALLELVKRSWPGLAMTHMAAPPSAISPRPDTLYFSLTLDGGCWKDLRDSHEIAVYVPDVFADVAVELHVLLEE